jgi:GH15 family glucan-1,4-alpha-glucosidase
MLRTMDSTHGSAFPPIANYAFLSDTETCALVAPNGLVEWMCLPRPDSPSVFGALLDRAAGNFALLPDGVTVPTQRRYLPGSMILETTWRTPTGWLVVHDSLSIGSWNGKGRQVERRRPPGEFVGRNVLLRVATCIDGDAEVLLNCVPLFDYGRVSGSWSYAGDGYESAIVRSDRFEHELRLNTNIQLGLIEARAYARTTLREGEGMFAALSWSDSAPTTLDEAYAQNEETQKHWRHWLKGGTFPDHPWRSYLERSALTLKGLSHAPTGAVMAAATTSLPETPGGERNWDYRFTWIRDSSFLLWGLSTLGFDWEAFEYFSFLAETVAGGDVQIMYGIDGEKDLAEQTLDHLSGYGGAKPVRIGNGAFDQKQHDVWGMLLDSFALHVRNRGLSSQLPRAGWELIAGFVDDAIAAWRDPDRGIWEVRGDPKHFTASKVMCWVAVDRGLKLAEDRDDGERIERWRKVADEMKAEICDKGVDERGVFKQRYDADALDASLLLIPLMGFLPPDDERVRATVLAIADELTEDGLVLRYRVDETDDGLSGEEGTFTICSFWLVSALAQIGEVERARALCERLLSFASPLELYAEEIDSNTGRHLGNFPQAFTHLSLINAVMALIEAER